MATAVIDHFLYELLKAKQNPGPNKLSAPRNRAGT